MRTSPRFSGRWAHELAVVHKIAGSAVIPTKDAMALRFDLRSLESLDDNQLVARFQDGDVDALQLLMERYRRRIRAKTRVYFIDGADVDDVEQEGMIGLFKAARDFSPTRQCSFTTFA